MGCAVPGICNLSLDNLSKTLYNDFQIAHRPFDIKNSPTSGQLKGYKIYAEISPEIYKLMTSENNRIKLRQVLCDEYLNVQ